MRNILLIIDVQDTFLKQSTVHIPEEIRRFYRRNRFDQVIQTRKANKFARMKADNFLLSDIPSITTTRSTYSALTDELRALLKKDDIIYIVGLETDACVLGTCFALFDAGYTFRVVREAVATNHIGVERAVFELMVSNFGEDALL